MSGTPEPSDAMRNLVIFMIYLAAVATIAVLFIYFVKVLPAQQAVGIIPPVNAAI